MSQRKAILSTPCGHDDRRGDPLPRLDWAGLYFQVHIYKVSPIESVLNSFFVNGSS